MVPQLIVVDRLGDPSVLECDADLTVMEAIRNAAIDGLLALCGGVCSCATCHVHVDPAYAAQLPPLSEDENALLDGCTARNEFSRLACQLRLTDELSGLRVTIADDD